MDSKTKDSIISLYNKAKTYYANSPEVFLSLAGKLAEKCCRELFKEAIGQPNPNTTLDKFIKVLGKQRAIPKNIKDIFHKGNSGAAKGAIRIGGPTIRDSKFLFEINTNRLKDKNVHEKLKGVPVVILGKDISQFNFWKLSGIPVNNLYELEDVTEEFDW